MSDNLLAYIKSLFCFDAVVQRTDPARWDDQSPCERWTARGVVDHNVRVCFMIAEMTRGNRRQCRQDRSSVPVLLPVKTASC